MIENINLILVTEESMILENGNDISLSLAMGIISSYLQEKGIKVVINDTNKIATNHNFTNEELEIIGLAYDKERVLNYIETGQDKDMDTLAMMLLGDSYKGYDSYGISIGADFSMLQLHLGFIFATFLRKLNKPIFIGGNNISYLYIFKEFYHDLLYALIPKFPFIMKGPGEQIIWELIDGLNCNKPREYFDTMDSLLRIVDGEVISNQEREPMVIRPNWDGLEMNDYGYPFGTDKRENENIYYRFPLSLTNKVITFNKMNRKERKIIIPYIFNYNCIYNCAFCTQSDSDRSGLIVGEVKKVIDDIEYLSKKYDSNYFYFLNNYFPSSLKYIKEFRDELKSRNLEIYWSDCARVNGLTLEKLQILYECGCRKLVFGFESGSEKILNLIDKRLNLNELLNVLKWCKEVGIWADVEVIIGLPYEREEEFLETYNLLDKNRDLINNFWLNEYFVVPNSLIGKYPNRYGVELLKDRTTYSDIMKHNRIGFEEKNYLNLTSNARLWGFNEVNEDSRNYEDIKLQNRDKIVRMSKLYNSEFNQLFDFYTKMIKIRKSKKQMRAIEIS